MSNPSTAEKPIRRRLTDQERLDLLDGQRKTVEAKIAVKLRNSIIELQGKTQTLATASSGKPWAADLAQAANLLGKAASQIKVVSA